MKYDVEADFHLLTTCNFRCGYCFVPVAALGAKIERFGTSEEWEEGFNATGKTWKIHITGGEPFVYPGFVELCQRLSRRQFLSINSNLSHRTVDEFAHSIDPGRVHYINAAMHYEEREKRASLDAFIGRVQTLRRAKFNVMVSLVMDPEMIEAFPSLAKLLGSHGLGIVPKVMRGKFQGQRYPNAYTPDQKTRIRGYIQEGREKYEEVIAKMVEPPTIDMFSDDRFLDGIRDYRGLWCGSGHNFVKMDPNGDVIRCGSGQQLGNVLRKTVRLLSSPKRCDTNYCPYFCEKYTSPEFVGKVEATPSFTQFVGAGIRLLGEKD